MSYVIPSLTIKGAVRFEEYIQTVVTTWRSMMGVSLRAAARLTFSREGGGNG